MTVLDLLDELEDIINTAPNVPFSGKVMVEAGDILEIVSDIRESLPDDVKQARWLKSEKDRILDDAKKEYEKIIVEAKKQADFLVDNNDITLKAQKRSDAINDAADEYSRQMKMRTYDYLDKQLYDMQEKMDQLNVTYLTNMFNYIEKSFQDMSDELQRNRDQLKELASRTKNGEEWLYNGQDGEPEIDDDDR